MGGRVHGSRGRGEQQLQFFQRWRRQQFFPGLVRNGGFQPIVQQRTVFSNRGIKLRAGQLQQRFCLLAGRQFIRDQPMSGGLEPL
jgi:hypothetical protein